MIKVLSIVGARPNFMKVAPLHRALESHGGFESLIVHTGQHYDERMSDVFFRQLGLPKPDRYLGVGSGSHAEQTARVMIAFEQVLLEEEPDLVVVVGDVNSTVACSLVATKLHVPVAHVEAGLRSGDRRMPEEVNRLVTDSISDFLFVTEQSGLDNLRREGIPDEKVFFVGNVMIDSLVQFQDAATDDVLHAIGVADTRYTLLTMHRPSNVDSLHGLTRIVEILEGVGELAAIVFPVHPRTRARLSEHGFDDRLAAIGGLHLLDPLGYLEFLALMRSAAVVVTDSGGIQEETTFLGVPCLTLRENTERPITVTLGTNELLPLDASAVVASVAATLSGDRKEGTVPPLWDGHAAERIADSLYREMAPFTVESTPAGP
jgi:UDP-N-acetylglucosamine 2-epimerase (non-hydrolysing)